MTTHRRGVYGIRCFVFYFFEKALDKLVQNENCTCLVIAHRLSTIRTADVIVVLEKGEIKEIGSHDALMEQNGKSPSFDPVPKQIYFL